MALRKKKAKVRRKKAQARPAIQGWATTDADEIERRRQRGASEPLAVKSLEPDRGFFADFLVRSGEQAYDVEIRSLDTPINSCSCPDYRVNGLGTCKHIEAVLHKLAKGSKRRFADAAVLGGPRTEIYLDHRDGTVRILWPAHLRPAARVRPLLSPFFSADGGLLADPLQAIPALRRTLEKAPPSVRSGVRLSRELAPWWAELERRAAGAKARAAFEADAAQGKRSLDVVKHRLYPYQREGMLHLAFTGRALLADEMGLGKTVQAVAACELLRRLRGIGRVLVIAPASLKAEWEEQIAKFTGLPSLIIQGPRAARLRQYRESAFFYLANYEQILPDGKEINEILAPDVIILDEAQRIKNWQAKTADAVKRLHSPYAFVLTGTPLENRIDEIYSIVQFLDPAIFGPLFRFNRDFYHLDERGRAIGYKNLDELHRRLRPIMLRRRKDDVEGQLPGRTVNTYFTSMAPEQQARYDEYKTRVARLTAAAQQRPLTKEELDTLQRMLACMRMLCDSPYILDPQCRISPKIDELANILAELTESGNHKIIIFSEWERMLELAAVHAETAGLGYAQHTGKIAQAKRRDEIRRFKDDPECRLFFSTDSGSVGLNLQVADVVINLDLPWNPAKLEQRIARAWRKHQKRPVQVINLVCEHSIEHRMLHLLERKRDLASSVVDGTAEFTEMAMPSGRAAFLERMNALMGQALPTSEAAAGPVPAPDPLARLHEDAVARWSGRLDLIRIYGEGDAATILVVVDQVDDSLREGLENGIAEHFPDRGPRLELLDRANFAAIQRLVEAGALSMDTSGARTLFTTPAAQASERRDPRRLAEARERLAAAERKQRMADLLADGGFLQEAAAPLMEGVELAVRAIAHLADYRGENLVPAEFIQSRLLDRGLVDEQTAAAVERVRTGESVHDEKQLRALVDAGRGVVQTAAEALAAAALE